MLQLFETTEMLMMLFMCLFSLSKPRINLFDQVCIYQHNYKSVRIAFNKNFIENFDKFFLSSQFVKYKEFLRTYFR